MLTETPMPMPQELPQPDVAGEAAAVQAEEQLVTPQAPELEAILEGTAEEPLAAVEVPSAAELEPLLAGTAPEPEAIVAAPAEVTPPASKILSDDERYNLTQMQVELSAGSVPDELKLKRDFSDSAKTHDEKQQTVINEFNANTDATLQKHDIASEAKAVKEAAQAHYDATTASMDADRAATAAAKEMLEKEMFKLKLNNGGELGVKAQGLEQSLLEEAQSNVNAKLGIDPNAPKEPTVTEQRQEAAEARQSEYAAQLKDFDRKLGAPALEPEPTQDAVLAAPDVIAPEDSIEEDDPFLPWSDEADTPFADEELDEVTEEKVHGRLGRLFQKAQSGSLHIGTKLLSGLDKVQDWFQDPEKGKKRKISVGVAGAVAVAGAFYLSKYGVAMPGSKGGGAVEAASSLADGGTVDAAANAAPAAAEVAQATTEQLSGAGDTIWTHAEHLLQTKGNLNPTAEQVRMETQRILDLNQISWEQARQLAEGFSFKT